MRHCIGISATKEHDDLQIGYLSLNGLFSSFHKRVLKGKPLAFTFYTQPGNQIYQNRSELFHKASWILN